ncbi:MAG TPA: AI-2E family transporter [Jiangellales bacterium]|nr:AI-2E family transporter [Jiangellales bacterium]
MSEPAGWLGHRPDVPRWLDRSAAIGIRLLVVVVLVSGAVLLVQRLQILVIAVVIGFAEVSLLWPVVRWARRRRVPQALAAVVSVALFLSFFVGILLWAIVAVIDSAPSLVDAVTGAVDDIAAWLADGPLGLDQATLDALLTDLRDAAGSIAGGVGSGVVTGVSALTTLVTIIAVASLFAIFALASGDRLWISFEDKLPADHRGRSRAAFKGAMQTAGGWFYASTITGAVDGLLIGLGLWVLDVPLVVPIAALTFLLAYIPLVGATIAGSVAVLVALFSGGPVTALWALGVVILVQQIEGNVLSPLLMSRAVSFHPLVVLLLTTGSSLLFGLAGLFLAVPIAGVLVRAAREYHRAARPPEPDPDGDADPATGVGADAEPDRQA